MKNKTVRVYVKGKGFIDIAQDVFSKIVGNDAVKTFTLNALKKGAEVGGSKLGEAMANTIANKVLPKEKGNQQQELKTVENSKRELVPLGNSNIAKEDIRSIIEQLEQKVKAEINSYSTKQSGRGYKIIR